MYSSVNVRKDTAESGVNSEPRTVESWAVSGTLVSTARVETTASLAERPVSSAVELIQLPKPRGAKTGAMNRPMPASMLSLLSLTHHQARIKALQDPDDDGRHENDRKRLDEEVLRLFPHVDDDGLGAGQAVGGQLHDKGDGLSLEDRVLEQQPVEHAHDHAADVQPDHHQRRRVREEGGRKRRVDGELCGAGHEGREQNRHSPVALAGQRARGHDRRHRAAKADQHRHERPAGEPDLAQQLVHHERHTRHVSAVLQQQRKKNRVTE